MSHLVLKITTRFEKLANCWSPENTWDLYSDIISLEIFEMTIRIYKGMTLAYFFTDAVQIVADFLEKFEEFYRTCKIHLLYATALVQCSFEKN